MFATPDGLIEIFVFSIKHSASAVTVSEMLRVLVLQKEAGMRVQAKVVPLPLPKAFQDHISWWPEKRWRRFSLRWATQRVSMYVAETSDAMD